MPNPGRVAIAGAVVLCCLAGSAVADEHRYRRTKPVNVRVELSERTRPKPKPAADPADDKPTLTPDELLALEAETRDLRLEQIRLLETLVGETPDDQPIEKADLTFRIADSYGQLSRFHRLESVGASIAGDQTRTAAHARQAKATRAQALAVYQRLFDNPAYRAYPGMHAALFAYAFTLQQGTAAQKNDARKVYHRLLTEYPSSRFVPHANLAFAEYFFEQRDLANAEGFYGKVIAFPSSNVYHYARYMRAWVMVNQGRHEDAGREFLTVLRETAGDAKQAVLHRAARKDFVRAFSEFGDVRKGWAMFQKLDAASAPAMFEQLAEIYVEQGKTDRSVFALRQLIKEVPKSPRVCAWQHDIAVSMLTTPGATVADKVEEIERLVKLHGALAAARTLPASALRECRDDAAAMSGEMARAFHSEADKTQDPALAALALRLYDAYIAGFPGAADLGETMYYRAELGWMAAAREPDARKASLLWASTARAFTAVVKRGKVDPALLAESASAAIDGWRNATAVDPRPRLTPVAYQRGVAAKGLPPPRPLLDSDREMLAAVDDYLAFIAEPRHAGRRVEMMFLRASTLRRYDHLEEALPMFEAIVEQHPGHETALYAANIALDIHILAGRHDRIAAWARWFEAHPGFFTAAADQDRSELAARVGAIHRIARRLAAEAKEQEARAKQDLALFVACGNAYLEIFNREVQRDPRAGVAEGLDEVLYNAGVCFEEGRSLSAAIQVYGQLRERFPRSKVAARALGRLGNAYARVAYYEQASASLEEYARTYAGESDAFKAMNDAVIFRRGLGDDEAAIADTRFFIKKFGKGKQVKAAADAFFSLGSIHEKRGELDEVVAHYRRYLATYGEQGGDDRVVVAYARIGEILWKQSCPVDGVDGACVEITRERAVGSHARKRTRGDATRTQCGPETKIKLTVVRRDPRKVAAAMAAFGQAITAFEKRGGEFPGGDARTARHAYALATFHRAEVEYERFLDVPFPTGLDFDPARAARKAASDARLAAWFAEKDRRAAAAARGYARLIDTVKDPATAIMGAARVAQVSQTFADALYTAEIPAFIRPYPEAVDAYCERLEEVALPYEEGALSAYGTCLAEASKRGWFSSWSRLCERELGQIKPEAYPAAAELRAAPDTIATATDVERPLLSIE